MPMLPMLVATWDDGLFSVTEKTVRQELADCAVRSLVANARGRVLAIVGGHSLCRRSADGQWTENRAIGEFLTDRLFSNAE